MKVTASLVGQLDELVEEVTALHNRLARTAEDVRFSHSFRPQGVVAELVESRKSTLDLSARLAEVEKSLSSPSETASAPLGQASPTMSPQDAVSLRPASSEESVVTELPRASLGREWEEAEARLSGLTQLIERALRAESASDAAMNLGDLALQYHSQKKFEEAERLYQHALAFREKFFGPEHSSVATDLNNLAILLQEMGRYEEASALLRRSLSIAEKVWGPEHPKLVWCLSSLGNLALKQKMSDEAKQLYGRARAIREKHRQSTQGDTKASLQESPETLDGKVPMQAGKEKAKAALNPRTETRLAAPNIQANEGIEAHRVKPPDTEQIRQASGRKPAEAKVSNYPEASFVVPEPIQWRRPAMPAWTWNVAALIVLSICALFVWKVTSRPGQGEIRRGAPAVPSFDSTPTPARGTLKLPDLLPGTRVRVDGIPYNLAADGSFAAVLSDGNHTVELTRPGYEPKSLSVELKAGQTVTIWGREVTVDSLITGKE